MKTVTQIHEQNTGKLSDKWASYLSFYDTIFSQLREQPISLLEIGVQNGGSLQTWATYFRNATHLVGCDINPKCGMLKYEDPRISVVVANANSEEALSQILQHSAFFDAVIDDGSHVSHDVINSFLIYFPLVRPGGMYIVEDAHALYMNQYGGGLLNELGAYAFFKRLIDVVSLQFWSSDVRLETFMRTFFPQGTVPRFIVEGWVDSLEFRNSIILIRKAAVPGHDKVGRRVITGTDASVEDWGGIRPGVL